MKVACGEYGGTWEEEDGEQYLYSNRNGATLGIFLKWNICFRSVAESDSLKPVFTNSSILVRLSYDATMYLLGLCALKSIKYYRLNLKKRATSDFQIR